MTTRGIVYIAFLPQARKALKESYEALRRHHPTIPVTVIGEATPRLADVDFHKVEMVGKDGKFNAASYKTMLLDAVEYDEFVYMDADTILKAAVLSKLFECLSEVDICLAPSDNQGKDAFWHVSDEERRATLRGLGYRPMQWQCGMMAVRRNEATTTLFNEWRQEWSSYKGPDQAAFVRALHHAPVRLLALGKDWNSRKGRYIQHDFGKAR